MDGQALKEWRESRGLSQTELAQKLGVNFITLSRWEREVQAIPPFLHLALQSLERQLKPRRK